MGCGAAAKASSDGKYCTAAPTALPIAHGQPSSSKPPRRTPHAPSPFAKASDSEAVEAQPPPRAAVAAAKARACARSPKDHWSKGGAGLDARASAMTEMFRKYEAGAAAAVAADAGKLVEPLVSPQNVQYLANILDADLVQEPFLVPAAKLLLSSSLAAAFRETGQLCGSDIQHCLEFLSDYQAKQAERGPSPSPHNASPTRSACAECSAPATCYCPDCEDTLCDQCFKKLHSRGNRAKHARLDVSMVGYKVKEGASTALKEAWMVEEQPPLAARLGNKPAQMSLRWHAFSDANGIRYFYNFERHERVREVPKEELAWQPPPPLLPPVARGS